MLFLILYLDHLKTIFAMFELMFVGALFDVMFKKLRNFDIL